LIAIITTLNIGCDNKKTSNEEIKISSTRYVEDTCTHDGFKPDLCINNIELINIQSVRKQFGDLKPFVKDSSSSLPYAEFLNDKGTEKLTVYLFYGTDYNELYQFMVEASSSKDKKLKRLKDAFFSTENNIKLGISKDELVKIKGNDFTEIDNVIKYILSDYEKSCFLQKYNLPEYFAEYTFNKDKLTKIYFGFKYP